MEVAGPTSSRIAHLLPRCYPIGIMTTISNEVQALSCRKYLSPKVLADEHWEHFLSEVILGLPDAKTAATFTPITTDRVLAERVNTARKTGRMEYLKMGKRRVDRNKKFRVGIVELAGKEPLVEGIEEWGGDLNDDQAIGLQN